MSTNPTTTAGQTNVSVAPISRQINHFIYTSLALSLIIFVCSMINFGGGSFWMSEAGFGLTLIHHFTILYNRWKLQRHGSTSSPLPISSRKPTIFASWFIALVYTAAFALVILTTVYMFLGYFEYWDNRFIASVVEAVFLFLEIPLMVVIALWCMRERRAVLGVAGAKWYHLSQYQRKNDEQTPGRGNQREM